MLEYNLSPLDILVFSEPPVTTSLFMDNSYVIEKKLPNWTKEQLLRLPDGVRQSQATHILLEFKFSESIDNKALIQALTHDYLYKNSKGLTANEVQTFIVSAKKPQLETRKDFGYEKMRYPGVYESQRELEQRILLISMNELIDKSYNAMFKLFATHRKERQKAFELLQRNQDILSVPRELESLLFGLLFLGEEEMDYKITPEKVQEVGKVFGKQYLSSLSPEQRLANLSVAEIEAYLEQLKKQK